MKRDGGHSFSRIQYGVIESHDSNVDFKCSREQLDPSGLSIETVENEAGTVLPSSILQPALFRDQQQFLEEMELKRIAHTLAVPTNDEWVKARLKELEEPIILFEENRVDRRARLRMELARRRDMRCLPMIALQSSMSPPKGVVLKPQTSEGSQGLHEARKRMLYMGFERASERLKAIQDRTERLKNLTAEQYEGVWERLDRELYTPMGRMEPIFSIIGDDRPLTSISYSGDGQHLVSASWTNACKFWTGDGECKRVWRGHTERVICARFHPNFRSEACGDDGSSVVDMASSGADCTIRLWSVNGSQPIANLTGHTDRVNKVSWHPSGVWLAASSHDLHWSLWDVGRQELLVRQDGHSLPVNCVSWHIDGSLIATGASDAMCVVWDVRLGKPIQFFKGHVKQVLSLDWHAMGVILASASEDNSVRLWDLRMGKVLYTIPAHSMLISDVKFAPHHGLYLVSASFDGTIKVWRSEDWSLVSVLKGHDSKVFSVDIFPGRVRSRDEDYWAEEGIPPVRVVSAGFDRTWKLWSPVDLE